jgi:hypothetical protein
MIPEYRNNFIHFKTFDKLETTGAFIFKIFIISGLQISNPP